MFSTANESSKIPNGPRKDSGKKSIGDKVYINNIKMTFTLGLVSRKLIPSLDSRVGAFLIIFGSSVIDLTIPGLYERLKLYSAIFYFH